MNPFDENSWWSHLLKPFNETIWWNHLMKQLDESIWCNHLMEPFDETIWKKNILWNHLMKPFDETIWWNHLIHHSVSLFNDLDDRVFDDVGLVCFNSRSMLLSWISRPDTRNVLRHRTSMFMKFHHDWSLDSYFSKIFYDTRE